MESFSSFFDSKSSSRNRWSYDSLKNFIHISPLVQTHLKQAPKDKDELVALQARLKKRFPMDAYNQARKELDPNRIFSNYVLEKLFLMKMNT